MARQTQVIEYQSSRRRLEKTQSWSLLQGPCGHFPIPPASQHRDAYELKPENGMKGVDTPNLEGRLLLLGREPRIRVQQ